MAKRIELKDGDVPAIEVEHVSPTKTLLKIFDYKGEILVQAQLGVNEAFELSAALENDNHELLTDSD